jgi:hypothetical protein
MITTRDDGKSIRFFFDEVQTMEAAWTSKLHRKADIRKILSENSVLICSLKRYS